jgi:hypothetical protein
VTALNAGPRLIKAKVGDSEQLQARREDVTFVMFAFPFRNHKKRDNSVEVTDQDSKAEPGELSD